MLLPGIRKDVAVIAESDQSQEAVDIDPAILKERERLAKRGELEALGIRTDSTWLGEDMPTWDWPEGCPTEPFPEEVASERRQDARAQNS